MKRIVLSCVLGIGIAVVVCAPVVFAVLMYFWFGAVGMVLATFIDLCAVFAFAVYRYSY